MVTRPQELMVGMEAGGGGGKYKDGNPYGSLHDGGGGGGYSGGGGGLNSVGGEGDPLMPDRIHF